MTQIVIRRGNAGDAEVLARIGAITFADTFRHLYSERDLHDFLAEAHSPQAALEHLTDPQYAVWLVEHDGQAIGHALAGPCSLPHPEVTPACGELKRIYMLKAWQSGGHGTRLLDAVLAWLDRNGPHRVWLGVWSENHGAQMLYARRGFSKVGEYKFVVGKTQDHEFILRRG